MSLEAVFSSQVDRNCVFLCDPLVVGGIALLDVIATVAASAIRKSLNSLASGGVILRLFV